MLRSRPFVPSTNIRNAGRIPQKWRKDLIISAHKQEIKCMTYKRYSLLNSAYKVYIDITKAKKNPYSLFRTYFKTNNATLIEMGFVWPKYLPSNKWQRKEEKFSIIFTISRLWEAYDRFNRAKLWIILSSYTHSNLLNAQVPVWYTHCDQNGAMVQDRYGKTLSDEQGVDRSQDRQAVK